MAARLSERHGYQRVAFADRLKEAALKVDPYVEVWAGPTAYRQIRLSDVVREHGWEGAKKYPEVRRFLQQYGQTVRDIDPDFWVRAARPSIDAANRLSLPVVVTDVRYANEARWLLNRGFALVRVTRPNVVLAGAAGRHKSETELADWATDMTVANTGTLNDLNGIVDSLLLPRS
ncbi:hypothetical protein [Streptomyces sp. NPDC048643]|uniref:deoxynucleotide monophosphate kinase family protein n=1 Tax=Streptomyces sp. NPDC048643 TaxID=3155637 RepID=UPI00341B9CFA